MQPELPSVSSDVTRISSMSSSEGMVSADHQSSMTTNGEEDTSITGKADEAFKSSETHDKSSGVVFPWLKNPFRRKDKHLKCKQENDLLREELDRKNQMLSTLAEELEKMLFQNKFTTVNVGTCQTLQVGDAQADERMMEMIDRVGVALELMTNSIQQVIDKRVELEQELRNANIRLREMHADVKSMSHRFMLTCHQDEDRFTELRVMLADLTADRTDSSIFRECVDGFVDYCDRHPGQDIFPRYDELPRSAKNGVIRLMNKFGKTSWRYFAVSLDVNPVTISADENGSRDLQQTTCTRILYRWITMSRNNRADLLLQKLENLEKNIAAELRANLQRDLLKVLNSSQQDSVSVDSQNTRNSDESQGSSKGGRLRKFVSLQNMANQDTKGHLIAISEEIVNLHTMVREIHEATVRKPGIKRTPSLTDCRKESCTYTDAKENKHVLHEKERKTIEIN